MTITRLRNYPAPSSDGIELTEVSVTELSESEAEFFAAMSKGIPVITGPVLKGNDRINELNQERIDHEAANPQTRNDYKGNNQ